MWGGGFGMMGSRFELKMSWEEMPFLNGLVGLYE